MLNNWNSDLKHKFTVKYFVDGVLFAVSCVLFMLFAGTKHIAPYDALTFLTVIIVINAIAYFSTKHWISVSMKKSAKQQSASLSEYVDSLLAAMDIQKRNFDTLSSNHKNVLSLIEKLKNISDNSVSTSKNTEKQVNQSINFSQKEHEAISTNAEKMVVLRQKIQMIAELILELSEHSQQIGNTISVVDDIAEQTNMLALNAAVEAARAGEHGKGFAVVAGEIRKLADESKQAITKITSLTSSIQFTTNSTVMATEEGSKEIESVVKDINNIATNSETLLNLIKEVLESLETINSNTNHQNEIIDRINIIDTESSAIAEDLIKSISENSEKISKIGSLSKDISDSAVEE